jgi:hypothetical protein
MPTRGRIVGRIKIVLAIGAYATFLFPNSSTNAQGTLNTSGTLADFDASCRRTGGRITQEAPGRWVCCSAPWSKMCATALGMKQTAPYTKVAKTRKQKDAKAKRVVRTEQQRAQASRRVAAHGSSTPPTPTALPAANSTPTTPVCIVPVPIAIKNLSDLANSRPSERQRAVGNINHLILRYCRGVEEAPEADNSIELGDGCYQQTGVLNGERVYWARCLAEGEGD